MSNSNRIQPVLVVLAAVMIIGYSCRSSRENHKQEDKAVTMSRDSMAAQNGKSAGYKKMPPGQAAVRGHVLLFNENKPADAVIEIDQVLGYGPATPMLATGQQVRAIIPSFSAADTTKISQEKRLIISGKTHIFILRHTGGKMLTGHKEKEKQAPAWLIQNVQP